MPVISALATEAEKVLKPKSFATFNTIYITFYLFFQELMLKHSKT